MSTTADQIFADLAFGSSVPILLHCVLHIYKEYGWQGCYQKEYPRMAIIAAIGIFGTHLQCWLIVAGLVPGSLLIFNTILVFWVMYTQTLYHIVLDRTSIMWQDRKKVRMVKIALHVFIGIDNIIKFLVWPPAQLGTWDWAVHVNFYFTKTEKISLAVMDAVLNLMFVYTFRSYTAECGNGAYKRATFLSTLYACASMFCDGLVAYLMFTNTVLYYTMGQAIAFAIKLTLELEMANLVRETVRNRNRTSLSPTGPKPQTGGKAATVSRDRRVSRTTEVDVNAV